MAYLEILVDYDRCLGFRVMFFVRTLLPVIVTWNCTSGFGKEWELPETLTLNLKPLIPTPKQLKPCFKP